MKKHTLNNLNAMNVVELTEKNQSKLRGGWVWPLVGIVVAVYLAVAHYAHEKHHSKQ